jgi:glutaredoxin-like YruB-family protein
LTKPEILAGSFLCMSKVEIYTTPQCAYCKIAKEFFKTNNITYAEYDVAKDAVKRQEMFDKTQMFGVPVIVIDGQIIVGFDKPKIKQLLKI